jgi:GTP-binding protein
LLHIIDISPEGHGGAWRDYELINRELEMFNPDLVKKPQVVAIGKTDLTATRERMKKDIDIFAKKGIKLLTFSAATGEGVQALLRELLLHIPPHRPPLDDQCGEPLPEEIPS